MWIRQPTSNAPLARCAHAADAIDGKLYVFGGWSEAKIFNDLHVYDPETQMWTKLLDDKIDPNILTCRSGHSATAVGKKLLIFGGGSVNETGSLFLNDILLFDTESSRWQMAYACGPTPAGRTKHTATLIGSKLYVFGGGDGLRLFNDIFCLDIETMTWSLPSCKGTPPCPRWGHSMVQAGSQLVIFGGHDGLNRLGDVFVFDTNTMTWRQEKCSRRSPPEVASPCAGHTATMVGPHMLLWGGGDGHVLTDMYALDTSTWQWWWAGNAPGTCAHTTTLVGNTLVAFGGGDGVSCFNDLYTFDVTDQLGTLFQAKPNLKVISPPKHAPVNAPALSISPPKAPRSLSQSPRAASAKFSSLASSSPPSTYVIPPTSNHTNSFAQNSNHIPDHTVPPPAKLNQTPHAPHTSPPQNHSPPSHLTNHTPPLTIPSSTSSPVLPQDPPSTVLPSFFDASAHEHFINGANNRGAPRENSGNSRRNSKNNSNNTSPIPTTPPLSPRDSSHINSSGGIQPRNNNNSTGEASNNNNNNNNSNGGNRSRRNSRPQTIAKWLQTLGMSKYLDRFVAEEIDIDILDMLTESHFKLLGIPLGDRLRLCAAISKFSGKET